MIFMTEEEYNNFLKINYPTFKTLNTKVLILKINELSEEMKKIGFKIIKNPSENLIRKNLIGYKEELISTDLLTNKKTAISSKDYTINGIKCVFNFRNDSNNITAFHIFYKNDMGNVKRKVINLSKEYIK